MGFEILQAENGFMIYESQRNYLRDPSQFHKPYVFETLEGALKFLKEKFEEKRAEK